MTQEISPKTEERITTSQKTPGDNQEIELSLRPRFLKEYIGQDDVKKNLKIFIEAAKKREEPLEHVLLHGPAGLGKTTLAHIIAREMQVSIKTSSGPALERQGDLAAIITNLKENDILFIDEIHRLRPVVEEVLYSAMEDFCLDLVVGKGPSARIVRLGLPKFTLIGATTKVSLVSSPLRDRFGSVFRLDFYQVKDIKKVIERTARILNWEIEDQAAEKIAARARQTPRIANRLLKRVRDFAEVHNIPKITLGIAEKTLDSLGVDELGLDQTDRNILSIIIQKFHGGPVGLNTIAAAISEEEATVEEIYEPYLLQLGFLERTPRGRLVSKRAYQHLGLAYGEKTEQKVLFP